jgi:hypothetical protein
MKGLTLATLATFGGGDVPSERLAPTEDGHVVPVGADAAAATTQSQRR